MNKYMCVIAQIVPLLDTLEDGLLHMAIQLDQLDFESAHNLLNDIFLGVLSIQEAVKPFIFQKPILSLGNSLIAHFKEIVFAFVEGIAERYIFLLAELTKLFKEWKNELLYILTPRIYH